MRANVQTCGLPTGRFERRTHTLARTHLTSAQSRQASNTCPARTGLAPARSRICTVGSRTQRRRQWRRCFRRRRILVAYDDAARACRLWRVRIAAQRPPRQRT